MNIAEILTQQESKTLEFKRDLSSLKPILKTLVAFANTAGGLLVIGKESNGEVVGVEDVESAEERLANSVADSIRPAMQLIFSPACASWWRFTMTALRFRTQGHSPSA